MKYAFNKKLFRNLYKILGCKRRFLVEIIGTTPSTFDYWYQSCDLPFEKLMSLCNELHLSISHFFISSDDTAELQDKEFYTNDKVWTPITTNFRLLADDVTIYRGMTTREAIKSIGISSRTFYVYFCSDELPSGMKMSKVIKIFNKANLYPGDYIIDKNREIPLIDGFKKREVNNAQLLQAALKKASNAEVQKKKDRTKQNELEKKIATLEKLVAKLAANSNSNLA